MNVWVLTIDHRHGRNTYVHRSEAGAKAELLNYVDEWWSELAGGGIYRNEQVPETIPTDADEAINTYFEFVGDEYYDLEMATLAP